MRRITVLGLILWSAAARAQETQRTLSEPGSFTKMLSPDQVDTWSFEGAAGEAVLAQVSSEEFDPTLELADGAGKVLAQADDEGSESWLALRLPAAGPYRLQVHAFEQRGGGSYELSVRRFPVQAITPGKPFVGAAGRDGWVHLCIEGAEAGQILVPDLQPASEWGMLDPKGRALESWAGAVRIEQTGLHWLSFQTAAGSGVRVLIHAAAQKDLQAGQEVTGTLQRRELDVWSFEGQPGQFRMLAIDKTGGLDARLIYEPVGQTEERLAQADEPPELLFLPVQSKGSRLRLAALLGRSGRYRLYLLARDPLAYKLRMSDPGAALQPGRTEGRLEIGGAAFYTFEAAAGQRVQLTLESDSFDPYLRLYDARGTLIEENDDSAEALSSRAGLLAREAGRYRAMASSRGDGGGGPFTATLTLQALPELPIGQRVKGSLGDRGRDTWSFQGKTGRAVIVYVRSAAFRTAVELEGPGGVLLQSAEAGMGNDSVLAATLPQDGAYTVWVRSRSGAGDYSIQLIDAE